MENTAIETKNTAIDDTFALEAMHRLMVKVDDKAKQEVAKEAKVYDAQTLLVSVVDEETSMMEEFCLDFARFWASADNFLRQAIRHGDGISEIVYDHSKGEFYYGENLVGKTKVKLDDALVRRYLTADRYWSESSKQNGLFCYDLYQSFLDTFNKN